MTLQIDHTVPNNDGSEIYDFYTDWYCPECSEQCQTVNTIIGPTKTRNMPLHFCNGLFGLLAPMVKSGVNARLRVNYREDYLGKDIQATDERGKVVMSITTERDNGEDLIVHSPCTILKLAH